MKTLDKLKKCSTNEIEGLSWETTELENQNYNDNNTYNSSQSYSVSVIGKPIRIGNLEIAQNDFPVLMNYNDANKACEDLGEGWRLPTLEEFSIIYLNRDNIGGYSKYSYWSGDWVASAARTFDLTNGNIRNIFYLAIPNPTCHVRAVRSF